MVEMTETAHILNHASDQSLIILDEIGRGTSTFDGVSIAWAVAEYIHDVVGSLTLFATHYHELTELSATRRRIKNYNVAVKQLEDKVVFLRQILPGATNRSYGIEVAQLAGLPPGVLMRAREILNNLEPAEFSADGAPRPVTTGFLPSFAPPPEPAPGAADTLDQVRRLLAKVDIDRTTPLKALVTLDKLKQLL
jgi:DNA mismatch repair protein MutS